MQIFKTKTALLAMAATQSAFAHSGFSNFYVNGVDQGDSIAVRSNPDPSKWTFPVEDLTSSDMACGFGGTKGVNRVSEVPDGARLTFEWRWEPNNPSKGVIDPSHMGPVAVYAKKVENAITDTAAGDGWFKLWDQGYDESSPKKWGTLNLIESKGLLSIDLPKGLVGGDYLFRPELLALHNANQGDPQYYIGCAQVFLKSSGSLVPKSTVSIPGYVSKSDPADSFDIWWPPMEGSATTAPRTYPKPGPPVVNFTNAGATTQTKQAEGQKPDDCILESGSNWCGVEVPDYTDETGCWAAGENCWKQNDACWKSAPATGVNCKIWDAKCRDLNAQCTAKNFQGPPNKGKDLTPPKKTISPPGPLGPTAGGDTVAGPTAVSSGIKVVSAPITSAKDMSTPAGPKVTSAVKPLSSARYYGNYSVTSVAKAPTSSTPVAPIPASSIPYEEKEDDDSAKPAAPVNNKASTPAAPMNNKLSTPMAAFLTAADGVCSVETVTVTSHDIITITVTPSPAVQVKPAATKSVPYEEEEEGDDDITFSTPAAPVAASSTKSGRTPIKPTGGHHKPSFSRNSTFTGYSTGYAVPSGFTRLPKYY